MINEPITVVADGFQAAWVQVVKRLVVSQWDLRNLVVQIRDPQVFDPPFHGNVQDFARAEQLLGPKDVAYTIFPHKLYKQRDCASELFVAYNKPQGFYDRVKTGWGTYFGRMTSYRTHRGIVNQLDRVITAIKSRKNLSKAAYSIVIQIPGGETIRPLGGPCLNYLAIQGEPSVAGNGVTLGLLAVYRNHDFLKRAYGNYWGLCNLLMFLARETGGVYGPLTCVSSHAYVDTKKVALRRFVETH